MQKVLKDWWFTEVCGKKKTTDDRTADVDPQPRRAADPTSVKLLAVARDSDRQRQTGPALRTMDRPSTRTRSATRKRAREARAETAPVAVPACIATCAVPPAALHMDAQQQIWLQLPAHVVDARDGASCVISPVDPCDPLCARAPAYRGAHLGDVVGDDESWLVRYVATTQGPVMVRDVLHARLMDAAGRRIEGWNVAPAHASLAASASVEAGSEPAVHNDESEPPQAVGVHRMTHKEWLRYCRHVLASTPASRWTREFVLRALERVDVAPVLLGIEGTDAAGDLLCVFEHPRSHAAVRIPVPRYVLRVVPAYRDILAAVV